MGTRSSAAVTCRNRLELVSPSANITAVTGLFPLCRVDTSQPLACRVPLAVFPKADASVRCWQWQGAKSTFTKRRVSVSQNRC